jgi:copper(I)-binding protein
VGSPRLINARLEHSANADGSEKSAPFDSMANAAIYTTITSSSSDQLISASAPVAKKTDLMTMEGRSGQWECKYLEAIDILAVEPVSLNPGGLHVWLAELNAPLRAGQTFPLTLNFKKAGERQITVSLIKPAEAPPVSEMRM